MAATSTRKTLLCLPAEIRVYIYELVFFPVGETVTAYRPLPQIPGKADYGNKLSIKHVQILIHFLQALLDRRPIPSRPIDVSSIPRYLRPYPLYPGDRQYPAPLTAELETYARQWIINCKRDITLFRLENKRTEYTTLKKNSKALLQINRELRCDAMPLYYRRGVRVHGSRPHYLSSLDPVAQKMVQQVYEPFFRPDRYHTDQVMTGIDDLYWFFILHPRLLTFKDDSETIEDDEEVTWLL